LLLRYRRIVALNLFILMGIAVCVAADSSTGSATTTPPKKKPPAHHATTRKTSSHGKSGHHSGKASRVHGQQKIDPQRARSIQEALIRDHYLSGEATGTWDANSQRAMEKFQADNGWQTKEIPDSRALIKLGLGPDQQHLLNPESAMTTPQKMRPPAQAKAQPTPSTTPASTPAPAASDTSSQN
jgi:hypothetical protein